jgi:hypothetical protein
MNILLIVGIIGLIAVISIVAYFMLGNKDIKYGNYVNNDRGRKKLYIKVSKDNVEFGNYVDDLPKRNMEFKFIKTDMTFKINGKEVPIFESSIPIEDNKTYYFAQSLIDGNIYILDKDRNGTFIKNPNVLVPSKTL